MPEKYVCPCGGDKFLVEIREAELVMHLKCQLCGHQIVIKLGEGLDKAPNPEP
jgi:DNA-directed RNA polymerase subunit RPC12/RpoP